MQMRLTFSASTSGGTWSEIKYHYHLHHIYSLDIDIDWNGVLYSVFISLLQNILVQHSK